MHAPAAAHAARMWGRAETVDIGHIKKHYFGSHRHINPSGIIPKGPRDWL